MERVVITGIGLVTPNAIGTTDSWRAVLNGESGIAPITLFDASQYGVRFAGEIKGFVAEQYLPKKKLREMGRFAHLSIAASKLCIDDAAITFTDEDRETCGTFIGVGLGGLDNLYHHSITLYEKGPSKISPYFIPSVIANLARARSRWRRLARAELRNTSACASSAHAVGEAFEWIRRGRTPMMLAAVPSRRSRASASAASTPCSRSRGATTIQPGEPSVGPRSRRVRRAREGAGVPVLESLTHAQQRGARDLRRDHGYGATCDAYHLTKPAPEGEGRSAP
jgi:3-oxoacyl-[acyl-carrier-protein] synthase II